jgi:hypothetical protein
VRGVDFEIDSATGEAVLSREGRAIRGDFADQAESRLASRETFAFPFAGVVATLKPQSMSVRPMLPLPALLAVGAAAQRGFRLTRGTAMI